MKRRSVRQRSRYRGSLKKPSWTRQPAIRTGLHTVALSLLLIAVAWAANFTINGNLIVNGDTTTNKLTAKGDMSTTGELSVAGNATTGKLTANGDISATGNLGAQKDLGAVGKLSVGGGIYSDGEVSAFSVNTTSDIKSGTDIVANGNLTVHKSATFMKAYSRYSETIYNGNPNFKLKSMGQWDFCALATVDFTGLDNGSSDNASCHLIYDYIDPTISRPYWKLEASAATTTNIVTCSAICMSFSATVTGQPPN